MVVGGKGEGGGQGKDLDGGSLSILDGLGVLDGLNRSRLGVLRPQQKQAADRQSVFQSLCEGIQASTDSRQSMDVQAHGR